MTEAQFQAAVIELATIHRWAHYHNPDSRRSTAGFPDLVLCGHGRVLFRELKLRSGRVGPHQRAWLRLLLESGADAGVWWEDDWPQIERELAG